MQSKLDLLAGKEFLLDKVKYKVNTTKKVSGNIVIITDRKTFNIYPNEFEAFMDGIEIIEFDREKLYEATIKEATIESKLPAAYVSPALEAKVIYSEEMTTKVADKLFDMFEILSNAPTEANYKQATAMKEMSNAIINTQLAKLKFLTLKQQ